MNSDVLSVQEKSKPNSNRFRSHDANKRMEIMRRERERKREKEIYCLIKVYRLVVVLRYYILFFLSFALYISECTISPKWVE